MLLLEKLLEHRCRVAGKGCEQACHVHERSLHRTGELRKKHFAWFDVGKLRDRLRRQELAAEKAALDHEYLVVLGEVLQRLRCRDRIPVAEGKAGWAEQQLVEGIDIELRRGAASERHLHNLELCALCSELPTQCLLILDRKTGVFSKEHGLCSLHTLFDFGDCLDLFWSWHVSSSSFGLSLRLMRPCTRTEPRRRRQGSSREVRLRWCVATYAPKSTNGLWSV